MTLPGGTPPRARLTGRLPPLAGSPPTFFPGLLLAATAVLATLPAAGCGLRPLDTAPEPAPGNEEAAMDPVGIYDLTMSSETMVSEGTLEIYGEPGAYLGRVSVGGVNGRIILVEPGEGRISIQVEVEGGRLVFRLAGDSAYLSGNWVMGGRRGTAVAERRVPAVPY